MTRPASRIILTLASLAVLALPACVPLDSVQTGSGEPLAGAALGRVVEITGPNAFVVTGGSTAAARQGQDLFAGDHFYTGAASRMVIGLKGGGTLELDENTDPILQQAGCLIISLFNLGRIFVDARNTCVRTNFIDAAQQSQVVYEYTGPSALQITVIEGQVTLRRPINVVIGTHYRINLQGAAVTAAVHPVTTAELLRSVSWTHYYQTIRPYIQGFDPNPQPSPRPRPPLQPSVRRPPRGAVAPAAPVTIQ